MKIMLDEQTVDFKVEQGQNLEQLLIGINQQIRENDNNKLMVDVRVDGQQVLNASTAMDTIQVADISTLEITTDSVTATVSRALEEIKTDLPKLAQIMGNISTSLQEGNKEEALSSFSRTCNEWRKIIQFFDNVATLLKIDYNGIEVNGKTVETINQELLEMLMETKTAIEKDDLVMMSDLIEYELAPKLQEEVVIVDKLLEYIRK